MPDLLAGRWAKRLGLDELWLAWLMVVGWVSAYAMLSLQGLQGLDIDSAEQVYFAQTWQVGYGVRQPPLYTWLLIALKPDSWSWPVTLEVMRYSLLVGWLGGMQALAGACGASRRTQALVLMAHLGFSLALWRVHDSLTHTVLAAVLVTWGAAAVALALHQPRWWWLAGVLAGLACLAKFSAALWWASSVGAAWWMSRPQGSGGWRPWCRHTVLPSLWATGLAALVASVYLRWWFSQRAVEQAGASGAVHQLVAGQEATRSWWVALDLACGVIEYALLGPLLLLFIGVWCAWRQQTLVGGHRLTPAARWLACQSAVALLATLCVLLIVQGAAFKSRWLWPVVPGLGVWMVLWAVRVTRDAPAGWSRALNAVAMSCGLLAIGAAALRWWEPELNAARCRDCWTDRPALEMARALHRAEGAELRVITHDAHLGGILAAVSPRLRTWAMPGSPWPAPVGFDRQETPCLLAWVNMDRPQPPQPALAAWREPYTLAGSPLHRMSWPLRHAPQRQIWLQFQRLDSKACEQARLSH